MLRCTALCHCPTPSLAASGFRNTTGAGSLPWSFWPHYCSSRCHCPSCPPEHTQAQVQLLLSSTPKSLPRFPTTLSQIWSTACGCCDLRAAPGTCPCEFYIFSLGTSIQPAQIPLWIRPSLQQIHSCWCVWCLPDHCCLGWCFCSSNNVPFIFYSIKSQWSCLSLLAFLTL